MALISNKDTYKKELKEHLARMARAAEAKALNSLMQGVYAQLVSGHLNAALELLRTEGPKFNGFTGPNLVIIAQYISQGSNNATRADRFLKIIKKHENLFPGVELHNFGPAAIKGQVTAVFRADVLNSIENHRPGQFPLHS